MVWYGSLALILNYSQLQLTICTHPVSPNHCNERISLRWCNGDKEKLAEEQTKGHQRTGTGDHYIEILCNQFQYHQPQQKQLFTSMLCWKEKKNSRNFQANHIYKSGQTYTARVNQLTDRQSTIACTDLHSVAISCERVLISGESNAALPSRAMANGNKVTAMHGEM